MGKIRAQVKLKLADTSQSAFHISLPSLVQFLATPPLAANVVRGAVNPSKHGLASSG